MTKGRICLARLLTSVLCVQRERGWSAAESFFESIALGNHSIGITMETLRLGSTRLLFNRFNKKRG